MIPIADPEKTLASDRDALVKSILSLEEEYHTAGTRSLGEYLRERHQLEQRLVQVMDELTRLIIKG
ncbi:MAG: hypothetical protein GYA24_20635 [Candidatus Lokiarchaeota archaeon]|nr:hypothetical protein [Candidatus Lokiarchaeota archaeon]